MNINILDCTIKGSQTFMEDVVIKDNILREKKANSIIIREEDGGCTVISSEEIGWEQLEKYINRMKRGCREKSNEYCFCNTVWEEVKRKNIDGITEQISKKKNLLNDILSTTVSSVVANGFWELLKYLHILI